MQRTPSFADIIEAAMRAHQSRVWTALPARVASYDAATQLCSAQPLVQNIFYDERDERIAERLPICEDVPVCFPGSGDYSITWPLAKGDLVLLVFTSCSLDVWISRDGREVDPGEYRRNHLSDAIAIPGIRPRGAALEHASEDGLQLVSATTVRLARHDADDPVVRRSDIVPLINAYNNHKHGPGPTMEAGGNAVTGDTGAPSLAVSTPACSPHVFVPPGNPAS